MIEAKRHPHAHQEQSSSYLSKRQGFPLYMIILTQLLALLGQ